METRPWWQCCVIYQLLTRSFLDSDGDGEGDFRGILQKLDYLHDLGVGAIWLAPIHPSPLADFGYDVSDYYDVHPLYGTLEDFDALVESAHARGLKVLLDWVPNHTSSEHPWFVESRSSRDNPKREWYIWKDPAPDGGPPNNWVSVFGGSVWTLDEATGQYFCHTFLEAQPDLNWRNPEVREEMFKTLRFWLDRGVDGFRIDALDLIYKDEQFRDNPPNPEYDEAEDPPDKALLPEYTRDQPAVHDLLVDIRRLAESYGARLLVGEMYLPAKKIVTYYGREAPELHLPMNPSFTQLEWNGRSLRQTIDEYMELVPREAWPTWMLSTHDSARISSRAGVEQTRVAAMLLMTLPGTPVLYYGEEIGMHDVRVPARKAQDPQGKLIGRSRDPARTPMQWDDDPNAGFTTAEPWLPVGHDYERVNVAAQLGKPDTLLAFYRRLMRVRQEEPALADRGYTSFHADEVHEDLLAYRRDHPERPVTVVLNTSGEKRSYRVPEDHGALRVLLSTRPGREGEEIGDELTLQGNEGVLLERA